MVKPPLSVRNDPDRHEAFLTLREGVPTSLMPSLLDWVVDHYVHGALMDSYVRVEPVRRLERRTDRTLPFTERELMAMFSESPMLLLDAVDLALTNSADLGAAAALSEMLDDARSAYTVGVDDDGRHELQLRQPSELTATAEAAAGGTGSAPRHLRRAWSLAFGREPEPTAACDEAVRAIEAVATAVVTPNDQLPTLGKMIAAMRDAPHKWSTDSDATATQNSPPRRPSKLPRCSRRPRRCSSTGSSQTTSAERRPEPVSRRPEISRGAQEDG